MITACPFLARNRRVGRRHVVEHNQHPISGVGSATFALLYDVGFAAVAAVYRVIMECSRNTPIVVYECSEIQ